MDKKVEVYWNLHKKLWSVREAHGRVLGHSEYVRLVEVDWVVQEGGRQRVLRERKKNVHAFARGYLLRSGPIFLWGERDITYNPYKYSSFMARTGEGLIEVKHSKYARFTHNNHKPVVTEGLGR